VVCGGEHSRAGASASDAGASQTKGSEEGDRTNGVPYTRALSRSGIPSVSAREAVLRWTADLRSALFRLSCNWQFFHGRSVQQLRFKQKISMLTSFSFQRSSGTHFASCQARRAIPTIHHVARAEDTAT
jgi:hypothetical protein